jgi:uncharacterized repeat protein (TIGR04138 family)
VDLPNESGLSAVDRIDEQLEAVGRNADCPKDAVLFVLNCLTRGCNSPAAVEGHLSASDFCREFLDSAIYAFREEAEAVLRDWRIERSEDLGRIVSAMVDAGLAGPSDDDRLEEFNGVFDLPARRYLWMEEEAEQLRVGERESKAILGVMTILGALAGIACFVAATWAEPRARIVLAGLGASMFVAPALLYLLAMHGYRRVRADRDR